MLNKNYDFIQVGRTELSVQSVIEKNLYDGMNYAFWNKFVTKL